MAREYSWNMWRALKAVSHGHKTNLRFLEGKVQEGNVDQEDLHLAISKGNIAQKNNTLLGISKLLPFPVDVQSAKEYGIWRLVDPEYRQVVASFFKAKYDDNYFLQNGYQKVQAFLPIIELNEKDNSQRIKFAKFIPLIVRGKERVFRFNNPTKEIPYYNASIFVQGARKNENQWRKFTGKLYGTN